MKDDGSIVEYKYFTYKMIVNGFALNDFFKIATFADQDVDAVDVRNMNHVLGDDRSGIEFGCHIMTGSADDLDATGIGRMIRFCPSKGGQKRVVNVDDLIGKV